MWQARKGTSTLFRADRRYASISKAVTLTADAFFTLEYAVTVPTVFHIDKQLPIKTLPIIKIEELHTLSLLPFGVPAQEDSGERNYIFNKSLYIVCIFRRLSSWDILLFIRLSKFYIRNRSSI